MCLLSERGAKKKKRKVGKGERKALLLANSKKAPLWVSKGLFQATAAGEKNKAVPF